MRDLFQMTLIVLPVVAGLIVVIMSEVFGLSGFVTAVTCSAAVFQSVMLGFLAHHFISGKDPQKAPGAVSERVSA